MAVNAFTPSGYAQMSVTNASSAIALPGAGTVRLSNRGPAIVIVLLGNSSVEVTESTGLALFPGQTEYLVAGSNDHVAAIAVGGTPFNTVLNIATGA